MDKLKIEQGEWVVVCDGAKALVLENHGDAMFPNLRTRETYEQNHAPTHEQGTDAPGRSHQSFTTARSAVGQTDWHDQAEHAFLKELAERLNVAVTKGEAKSMVVIASPRALGMIRPHYTHAVTAAIREEIAKDYVKMPVFEIEKILVGTPKG
jgi:protein required for attachment to host cells